MVEFLRYFIFFYCFLGVFIAGGLFFKHRSPANIFLALFILFFTFEQLDFMYTTSEVVFLYPDYYLWIYPICLLFGPALWLHFKHVQHPSSKFNWLDLLHGLPFLLFLVVLLSPILSLQGAERIEYTRQNFNNEMMPLNYIRTTHVVLYGLWMLIVIGKNKLYQNNKQGLYLTAITVIYFLTAVLQSYLTRFADSYRQFSWYFFLAFTIVLIAGFVLYSFPELLQQIQQKYFSSSIKEMDRKRIVKKITEIAEERSYFLDSALQLNSFCERIEEKPHQVSQVFSSHFETSFSHYVNDIRVDFAKSLLLDPKKDHLKILAVAFESGFNNNVTFNKAFSKVTGMTPGKFRKNRPI